MTRTAATSKSVFYASNAILHSSAYMDGTKCFVAYALKCVYTMITIDNVHSAEWSASVNTGFRGTDARNVTVNEYLKRKKINVHILKSLGIDALCGLKIYHIQCSFKNKCVLYT